MEFLRKKAGASDGQLRFHLVLLRRFAAQIINQHLTQPVLRAHCWCYMSSAVKSGFESRLRRKRGMIAKMDVFKLARGAAGISSLEEGNDGRGRWRNIQGNCPLTLFCKDQKCLLFP